MPAKLTPGPELWLANLDTGSAADVAKLHAIALKAFEVRSLQREFFRHHSQDTLTASKQAERQLDGQVGLSDKCVDWAISMLNDRPPMHYVVNADGSVER